MNAARYSRVTRRLWGDATFRSLRAAEPSPRELWLYLLTCPEQCAVPGIFRAFEGGIADALGWSIEALREAYGEVSTKGLARADWKAGVVVLPKAFFHNLPDSPNHVLGWRIGWDEIPECQIKHEYYHELKGLVEGLGEPYAKALAKGLREPYRYQEQDQDQDQDLKRKTHTERARENTPDSDVRLKVSSVSKLKQRPRRSTKATIPDDWNPSKRCLEILAAEGIQDGVALACLADFVDYWRSEQGLKADWDATFRGRVRYLRNNRQLPSPIEAPTETSYIEIVQGKRVRQYVRNGAVVRSEPAEQDSQQPLPEVG